MSFIFGIDDFEYYKIMDICLVERCLLCDSMGKMECDAHGGYIKTYSGFDLFPEHPDPKSICIEDIANALSKICRWGGHISEFYSVAQHSILVSRLCEDENALVGLLHDASEAYYGDMVRPLKYLPQMRIFRDFEKSLSIAIAKALGLDTIEKNENVDDADQMMLALESLRFRHNDCTWPLDIVTELEPKLKMSNISNWLRNGLLVNVLSPKHAKDEFLWYYYKFTGDIWQEKVKKKMMAISEQC